MTDALNLRELALDLLLEINEKGTYSHLILADVLDKYQYLSKQERAFFTRLVEGTTERRIELDYILDAFSKTKVKKMKPLIRNLLRMSVYQIKYMDAVPDSAVCNEAVKLAKKRGFSQLSGFVNGVLRSVARELDTISYPKKDCDAIRFYSVTYAVPEWLAKQWISDYGEEVTERILKGFCGERPLTARTNLTKTTPEALKERLISRGCIVGEIKALPYAFELSGFDFLNDIPEFVNGEFYVQDVSSMLVAEAADPKRGDYVIDVCAAPGGKSTHIAELLDGTGMVEARDLTEYKVGLIEENIRKHGLLNMRAVQQDACVFDETSVERADVLICDLPCSGLGVLGKKTDIRHRMTPEQERELAALQRRILSAVQGYVKHGGSLLYSTCTIDKTENEDNVEWFCKNYPEYALVSERQILPGEAGADGFFIAKLVRG